MEDADAWASLLPDELLLDIFRRLGGAAVMSCAGVCKPWRRAIKSNASALRPLPDTFVPSLLLGFFGEYISSYNGRTWLYRTPAPSQPELPEPNPYGYCSLAPTLASGTVLSSRDGFLLIKRCAEFDDDLCLWNPITGACTFIPVASFGGGEGYTLVTSYDDLQTLSMSSKLEVRILAVKVIGGRDYRYSFHYQFFTAATSGSRGGGAWGPVQRSQDFDGSIFISVQEGTEVVCRGGTVHWRAWYCPCTVALDVRTGRTWTTELPLSVTPSRDVVVLATSRDGRRLSVIMWLKEQEEMQVWVLTGGGDQWILRRVIDVRKLVPGTDDVCVWMDVFCPRSGCLRVHVNGQMLLLDVDRGSSSQIREDWSCCRPYHMDWSSYWSMCVSKMKYF